MLRIKSIRSVGFIILGLLAIVGGNTVHAEIRVLHSGPSGLDIEVATTLRIDSVSVHGTDAVQLRIDDWPTVTTPGEPALPYLVVPIVVPVNGTAHAMIVEREDTATVVGSIVRASNETMIGANESPIAVVEEISPLPQGDIAVEIVGIARDVRLARVVAHPVRMEDSRVIWPKRMRIAVRFSSPAPRPAAAGLSNGSQEEAHPARFVINADQLDAFRMTENRQARLAAVSSPDLTRRPRLQMYVNSPGIYRITGEDLRRWSVDAGIDVTQIDPKTLRLWKRGREVKLYVESERIGEITPASAIEFYAEPNIGRYLDVAPDSYNDPYVDPGIYWLTWGDEPGARMYEKSVSVQYERGPGIFEAETYRQKIHFEQGNGVRFVNHFDDHADRFFWRQLTGDAVTTFQIRLDAPVPNTRPTVRVMARGGTNRRHSVEFRMGGVRIFSLGENEVFQNQDLIYGEATAATEMSLLDGINTFEAIPGGSIVSSVPESILLNWFEIEYDRYYRTSTDFLEFTKPSLPDTGTFTYTLSGFTVPTVSIYKVGSSKLVNYSVTREIAETGYEIQFQDRAIGDNPRYIALTNAQKLKPFRVDYVPPRTRSIRDLSLEADYLIIAHEALVDAITPLAEYRETSAGGGHRTTIVSTAEIYDEFDWGYPTYAAIQEFLAYTFDYWRTPPRYLLIVGDGVDKFTAERLAGDMALIPIPMVGIYRWGIAGSDHVYSLQTGDDMLPDLFVARLPAPDVGSVEAAVEKIIQFEQSPTLGDWRKRVTMVSGIGVAFTSQVDALSLTIPDRYEVRKFYSSTLTRDFPPFEGRKEQFIDLANEGALWTIFLGHAGGGIWDANRLLEPMDAHTRISNAGKAGIFLSMTCFTGAWESPGVHALSETMMFSRNGGAVAWFGANGVGWYYNDYLLTESLLSASIRATRSTLELGEIIAAGKTDYALRYGSPNPGPTTFTQAVLHEFSLVGDPAMKIRPPEPTLTISPSVHTPVFGQQVGITGSVGSTVSGTAVLAMYDDEHLPRYTFTGIPVANGSFSTTMTIPDSSDLVLLNGDAATGLTLKGYVSTTGAEPRDWTGHVRLAVRESLIDSVLVESSSRDSVFVSAIVRDSDGIDVVTCIAAVDAGSAVDEVPMARVDGTDRYRTTRPLDLSRLQSTDPAAIVRIRIRAIDTNGQRTIRDDIPAIYPNRASKIAVSDIDIDGIANAEIAVSVKNTGTGQSDSTLVRLFLKDENNNLIQIASATATPLAPQLSPGTVAGDIQIGSSARIAADDTPLILPQAATVRLSIPDSLVRGRDPAPILVAVAGTNASPDQAQAEFVVPRNWGVYSPGAGEAVTVRTNTGTFTARILPGTLTDATIVTVVEASRPAKRGQPDIVAPDTTAYVLAWRGSAKLATSGELRLAIAPDTTVATVRDARDAGRLRVGYWNTDREQWEMIGADLHTWSDDRDTVSVPAPRDGTYGLLIVNDDRPPTIEVTVTGQNFGDGARISESSRFLVQIEDRNGVSTLPGDIAVWIDDSALPDSSITVPGEPGSATSLVATVTPPRLIPREAAYRLRIVAHDAAGNDAEYIASFRIAQSSEALMDFYGTFPNPFGIDGTVIAFSLSTQMEEVRVRIYDVAGRLVLRFSNFDMTELRPDDPTVSNIDPEGFLLDDFAGGSSRVLVAPDYHELRWSGANRRGEQIANGIYFGIISVRDLRGNTQEHTFTMMKAE